jgi:hypothetical protein
MAEAGFNLASASFFVVPDLPSRAVFEFVGMAQPFGRVGVEYGHPIGPIAAQFQRIEKSKD